nr:DUF4400 domain-containing protein [uncultured Halomonas sp.]
MRFSFTTLLFILAAEITFVLAFIPGDWINGVIEREADKVERTMGTDSMEWISATALTWYNSSMIDSGVYKAIHHHVIPTEAERSASTGMEGVGNVIFPWAEGRIEAVMHVIYHIYSRVALVMIWAPYLLLLVIPAVVDGVMRWKVKTTSFDYASPVMSRYGARGMFLTAQLLLIAFVLPIALNPLVIPAAMMGAIIMLGLFISNYQKRI